MATVFEEYNQQFYTEDEKDVTFIFENSNQVVTAHKFIIKTLCPVLKGIIQASGPFKEKSTVTIHDTRPEIFKMLIMGMYLIDINPHIQNMEDAVDLYHAAVMFEMDDFKVIATEYMVGNVNTENCLFLHSKATIFKLHQVLLWCEHYFGSNPICTLIRNLSQNGEITEESFIAVAKVWNKAEGELYQLLETYVETGKIKTYKNILKFIHFVEMSTDEIIAAKLLTAEEKIATIDHIEANKNKRESFIQLPPHICLEQSKNPKIPNIISLLSHLLYIAILLASPSKEYTSLIFKKMMSFTFLYYSERSTYKEAFERLFQGKRLRKIDFGLLETSFKNHKKTRRTEPDTIITYDANVAKIGLKFETGDFLTLISYEFED